jgi:hypothetical protein
MFTWLDAHFRVITKTYDLASTPSVGTIKIT